MASLSSLVREVEQDVKDRLSNDVDNTLEVKNLGASMAKNSITLQIEGDIEDLFPELLESENIEDATLQTCKIRVDLDDNEVNLKESDHRIS